MAERQSTAEDTLDIFTASAGDLVSRIEAQSQALTVQSFADLLQLSYKFIYKQIQRGSLPAYRLSSEIRIDPKIAAGWLRARVTVPEVTE